MNSPMVSHNRLLRKEHYLNGYTVDLDDHVITLRRHGKVVDHYGINTPIETIHHDVDQQIETEKAVTMEPFKAEDFQRDQLEIMVNLKESYIAAGGVR